MRACLLLILLLLPGGALAADDPTAFAWQQNLGGQVPLDTVFHDETGGNFVLRRAFGGAPVIFDPDYYHCPSLCGVVRADLLHALSNSGLVAGRDYVLVSMSIDPAEKPEDAATAKAADLHRAGQGDPAAWHYLTGGTDAIAAVSRTIGFRDRYDDSLRQFLHPAGLVVLTKDGIVSGYLLGVGYAAGDLRAAVLRAGEGGIARTALPVLLLCFHFDPSTGRYTLAITKVLRLMGVLTVLTIAGLMVVLHRRRPDTRGIS